MTLNKTINIINVNNTQQKNTQFGNNSLNNSSAMTFSIPLINSGFNQNILASIVSNSHNSYSINNSNYIQNTGNSNINNHHQNNNQVKTIGRIEFSIEEKKNDDNNYINIASCVLYSLIESVFIYLKNNDERENKFEGIFNDEIINEIKNQILDFNYFDNIFNKYNN